MYTEVRWEVKLNKDRSANHKIHLKIHDFGTGEEAIPSRLSITFDSQAQVGRVTATTNGENHNWKRVGLLRGDTKSFFCDISEIVSQYGADLKEVLETDLTFDEENAVMRLGKVTVVELFYLCTGLKATSIETSVHLPKPGLFLYAVQWIRKKIFRHRAVISAYRILQSEGGQSQRWDSLVEGRIPIIRFRSPVDHSGFPLIKFGYELAGTSLILLIVSFFFGVLTLIILPIILNLLSDTLWVRDLFNRYLDYFLNNNSG